MPESGVTDGRRLRSERSRRRLVEAAISFIEEHGKFPTAAELSTHSGVAHRSIFRLFSDLDEVRTAVITRRADDVRPLFVAPDVTLPLDERIAQFAKTRTSVHEKINPVREVGVRQAHQTEALAALFAEGNKALRDQAAAVFAAELKTLGTSDRRIALNTVDAALSWEFYHRLRFDQELSKNAVQQVIINVVTAALPAAKGRKRK
ncbi:MAG: hypothetical protein GX868_15195 [Actinobacteria bacterium]|nr:hypothetical protein [Actinomycetota bacterium]